MDGLHPRMARFVSEVEALSARETAVDAILSGVAALAAPLAENRDWLEPRFYAADEDQGFGISILHQAPEHGLLVETIAWLPGRGVAPHDHQTWGVVVGLDGAETNVDWRRLDDGATAGFADLEVAAETVAGPGDCVLLRPDDIHSVRNDGAATALSLHVYGHTLAHMARSEFDPIAKVQRPCPQRVRR